MTFGRNGYERPISHRLLQTKYNGHLDLSDTPVSLKVGQCHLNWHKRVNFSQSYRHIKFESLM